MGAPQYEQAGADVAGTGTANYVAKWTGGSTLGDSIIFDNGTNVGIGTASPVFKLDIVSSEARLGASTPGANTYLYLGNGVTSAGPYGVGALQYSGQAHTAVFANSGYGAARASLGMVTGGVYTPALSADPSGNVGIGTASPGAQLQVERAGGLSNAEYLRLRNTSTGSGSAVGQDYYVHANTVATGRIQHTWTGTTYDTSFSVWNNTLSSLQEAMRIQGGGNVGIGTASPGTRLHVLASAPAIATIASSNATQGYIQFNYNSTTTFGYIGNGASVVNGGANGDFSLRSDTGVISFATGGNTERMRIDSSGNVYAASGTTGMTNGFFYIPGAAGAPTGTPTAVTGRVPMYYDTTNNKFYVYNGAWKQVTLT